MEKTFNYYAFISYKREDKKWAKWLQHKLEYYKLPVTLKKQNPTLPNKIRPIFRDSTDLEPGFLTEKIKDALNASKFLIVICSPNAAKSTWVNKEVEIFIESGRTDKIIPFIIDGTPNAMEPEKECFPPYLRKTSTGTDILGADIHEMGRDAASIKVISSMFNIRFDELWQRYKRDKKKQQLYIIAAAILAFLAAISIGFLYIDRNRANKELQRTNKKLETINVTIDKERIRLLATNASALVEKGEVLPALRMAVEWLPSTNNNRPFVPEMMSVLNKSMYLLSNKEYKIIDKIYDEKVSISPDGRWGAYTLQGEFYLYDYHKQTSYHLKGHDITDEYDFKFSTDSKILYGRGIYKWMAWETNTKKSLNPDSMCIIKKDNYEDIANVVIPGTYQYVSNTDSIKYNAASISYNKTNDGEYAFIIRDENNNIIGEQDAFADMTPNIDYAFNPTTPEITFLKKLSQTSYEMYQYGITDNEYKLKYSYLTNGSAPDENSPYILYLPTGKEICINGQLLSRKYVKLYQPTYKMLPNVSKVKDFKKIIRYDNKTWQEIDRNEDIRLYMSENQDEINSNIKILWHNVKSDTYKSFTPFLPYSLGNGIAYLFTAYIADDTHVLCVAGQERHLILDVTSDERRYLEEYNINTMYNSTYDFTHIDIYIVAAQLFNNRQNLFTISQGGTVSIFDVPSGCLVKEFIIPYKNEEKFKYYYSVESAYINQTGTEITVTITENSNNAEKYSLVCKVPDERTLVDHAIKALNNFWN